MDSASNEAYERGVADGRQEHQLKDTAKRLNINTDSLGDISLVKQAIIRKANPEVNMDSWSDEQVDVALSMALVACGKSLSKSRVIHASTTMNQVQAKAMMRTVIISPACLAKKRPQNNADHN